METQPNTSRTCLVAGAMLLLAYLGGFAVLRANCDTSMGSLVMLPECLRHHNHMGTTGTNRFGWFIVTAYEPLFQLDMKLAHRSYLRSSPWSGEIIKPWF